MLLGLLEMEKDRKDKEQRFVEEVGLVFEQTGLPRMAGRVFGCLLISDPPHQSTDQLAEVLMASKGSISTMTRLLIQIGLIERLSLPGVRHDYFRLRTDACHHMIRRGLEDEIKMFRQLAERGMELVKDKDSMTRQWMKEMRDLYAFFEREYPALLGRWENKHKKDKLQVRGIP